MFISIHCLSNLWISFTVWGEESATSFLCQHSIENITSEANFLTSSRRKVINFPYIKSGINFSPQFDISDFINSLNFSHSFFKSGRKAVYFGPCDYIYVGGIHFAQNIHANKYVSQIFTFISANFPELMLNSCLINYYPNKLAEIPFHSDNEKSIDLDSWILTISFGMDRTMTFKCIDSNKYEKVKLSHGDIILFSRASQEKYLHAILPESHIDTNSFTQSARISATFRKIISQN